MDTLKLYNLDKLEAMGNQSFTDKMISLFIQNIPLDLDKIEKALYEHDFDLVSSIAHKIKPSAAYVCTNSVFEDVKSVEVWEETDDVMIQKTTELITTMKIVIDQLKALK